MLTVLHLMLNLYEDNAKLASLSSLKQLLLQLLPPIDILTNEQRMCYG